MVADPGAEFEDFPVADEFPGRQDITEVSCSGFGKAIAERM